MPELQPGQFEYELIKYGFAMTREIAEPLGKTFIGIQDIKGVRVRIVDIYLKDDMPDGSKGCVIAICEPVEPRVEPYKSQGMEYK